MDFEARSRLQRKMNYLRVYKRKRTMFCFSWMSRARLRCVEKIRSSNDIFEGDSPGHAVYQMELESARERECTTLVEALNLGMMSVYSSAGLGLLFHTAGEAEADHTLAAHVGSEYAG